MADFESENTPEQQSGAIKYLDGSVLLRPQTIRGPKVIVAGIIVAAAVAIGGFALVNVADSVVFAAANEQKAIEQTLAKDPGYNFPVLKDYIGRDDESARAALEEATENLYDVPATNDSTVDVIKLNPGVTGEQAAALYVAGGKGVSAKQAVDILYGSWRFDIDHTGNTMMRLRFADFTSGSPEAAINSAMSAQGIDESNVSESGLDEAGNTYRTGTVEGSDGNTYTWRASAINLSEMYSVNGLPKTAIYVGFRISA